MTTSCTCTAICVVTCSLGQRPGLDRLITAVAHEIANLSAIVPARHVLIVNRDARADDSFGVGTIYEPKRGYSFVRNRALESLHEGEAIVFIDDDEIPLPGWLAAFWERHLIRPTSLLKGPVIAVERGSGVLLSRNWAGTSGKREQLLEDDAKLPTAGIGNALIGSELTGTNAVYFDPYFWRGAEDTDLCMRLAGLGYDSRYVAAAVVHEEQDEERGTVLWRESRIRYDRDAYAIAGMRNFGLRWALSRLAKVSLVLSVTLFLAPVSRAARQRSGRLRGEIRAIWRGKLIRNQS